MCVFVNIFIIIPGMISILLHFDGLGYFLLVICQNMTSYGAGMFNVLSNRIGDVALLTFSRPMTYLPVVLHR
jgi:hypothetical protein